MVIHSVFMNGPPSPTAGTTASVTSATEHEEFHKQSYEVCTSSANSQSENILKDSVTQVIAEDVLNNYFSEVEKDAIFVKPSEDPEIQDDTQNRSDECEDVESDGVLVIDDDINNSSLTSKNKNQSNHDQPGRSRRRNGNRFEVHQKVDHAKNWLVGSVMAISSAMSVVSLSAIEDAYQSHCQETGQEPLSTSVLARLIHSLFQDAEKCRLGPRGNQRIHYRNLQLKSGEAQRPQAPTPLDNIKEEETDVNQTELDGSDHVHLTNEEPLNLSQKSLIVQKGGYQEKVKASSLSLQQSKNIQVIPLKKREVQEQEVSTSEKANQQTKQSLIADHDDKEGCEAAAKKLSEVMKWISKQGRKDILLKDFAHSASCKAESCSHLCLMFRRVRRHVVAARHSCNVLKLYSMLLRSHVSSCTDSSCGLPACPALRATRPAKRTIDDLESSSKRPALKVNGAKFFSSKAVFEPRSPGGSLPGSPVNSPPPSPDAQERTQALSLNPGSVQYMIVPVFPVVLPTTGKIGA